MEQVAEEIQRLARVEIAVEIRFLRQIADARLGLHVPRRMTEDLDVPLGRIQQPEQQLHRGGLARAVRPEQPEHLATPDFEVHIVHRARLGSAPEIFEKFCQPAHGDDDFAVRLRIADCGLRNSASGSHWTRSEGQRQLQSGQSPRSTMVRGCLVNTKNDSVAATTGTLSQPDSA